MLLSDPTWQTTAAGELSASSALSLSLSFNQGHIFYRRIGFLNLLTYLWLHGMLNASFPESSGPLIVGVAMGYVPSG